MDQQRQSDRLTEREIDITRLIVDGLSNHEIAEKLVLTHGTVKWYCGRIYSKLGVNTRAQAIRRIQVLHILERSDVTRASPTLRLPAPLTPFIGREREIAQVCDLLRTSRLLTLTGTGGTGKTRLALQCAERIALGFADGVSFIDLAPVAAPPQVANAIAGALGVMGNVNEDTIDTLKRALSEQEHLLLIDNFEHVIECAPIIPQLLANAPRVKILITSREALRVSGEQEYRVPPMTLPPSEMVSVEQLTQSEATALFIQRARMALPDFQITPDDAVSIAQICRRLDGLPLAIELAAARCKLLSPYVLRTRLGMNMLAGGSRDAPARQQTLRSTIEWSYNLLDDAEKMLFARMAVFRGGRSLEAVEAVCTEGLPIDVMQGMSSLVDKSLVQRKTTRAGEVRFVMLETLHEFAWERLIESGEADTMRQRHAAYFVALTERAEPQLRLAHQWHWFQILEEERENLHTALEWSLSSGDIATGLRIAGALYFFWFASGYHAEGYEWTQRFLNRIDEAAAADWPKFLVSAAGMAVFLDADAGTRLYTRAIEAARSLGDQSQLAWALTLSATALLASVEHAMSRAKEGLALFQQLDDKVGIAQALILVGEIARVSGDDRRARSAYEESLAITRHLGDWRMTYIVYANLSMIARNESDHRRSIDLIRQGFRLAGGMSKRYDLACDLGNLAPSIAALGHPHRAARLLGFSDAVLENIGAFHQPVDRVQVDRDRATVRAQLDDDTFQAAWAEGRKMTLEQALSEALAEDI